ncbi:hypothetical protein, partial [Xenorhabdus cabanillasii]|uniref:hypothetical protein n=1 Tax=Xenorhabdus cabanillasii TaxID=351673 RepID=UPI001E6528A4
IFLVPHKRPLLIHFTDKLEVIRVKRKRCHNGACGHFQDTGFLMKLFKISLLAITSLLMKY